MSVLFSDEFNKEWGEFTEAILKNSISREKGKNLIGLLEGSVMAEIAAVKMQHKEEVGALRLKISAMKAGRVNMVDDVNKLLEALGGIK